MAATGSEAIMGELIKEGWEWIKSERFHKLEADKAQRREANNPMKSCVLKFDHFENIHRLPKGVVTVDGAPNLRQVPGYLVFGTGQPTKEGFKGCMEVILRSEDADLSRPSKIMWTNMRQEPVVYMNGQSFTPRLADKMNENMEFPGATGEDIEWMQNTFVATIFQRLEDQKEDRWCPKEDKDKVKYYRDTYAEHPDDRENIEYTVPLENNEALVTLSGMYDQVKNETGANLEYSRLPIVDEKAPNEKDFDDILDVLRTQTKDTACVFNCQMGKGRTTTGMILACLLKDILYGDQSKTYWVDDTVDPKEFDEDELAEEKARRGQYSVIAKLFECVPEAREAKAHLDKIIDLCGEPATGGTGLQNLRECILWTQQKHDFEPKKKRPFWKQMSKNFIERYYYLVCFATYCKIYAPRGFDWTFTMWMDCRAELRETISQGKKNFNWD